MKGYFVTPKKARAVSGFLIPTLMLTAVGCSDGKQLTVNGSLSYKGEPVPAGIVKFFGPGDHFSMAYVREGAFIVSDLPPGDYKVTVERDASSAKEVDAKDSKHAAIPMKYADPKTSSLVYTITPKTRDLAINLD